MSPAISTGPRASWSARMPQVGDPDLLETRGDLGLRRQVHRDHRDHVPVDALEGHPIGVPDSPVQMLARLLPQAVAHQGRPPVDRRPAVGAPGHRRRAGVLPGVRHSA